MGILVALALSPKLTAQAPQPVSKPNIVTRSEWGARPPRCEFERNPCINAVTVHHTATSNEYSDAREVVRAIQRYHQDSRGWCDIGYHFLIDRDGVIYEGRPLWAVGAHVRGRNVGNVGVALIGNYEEAQVSERQMAALVELVSWLVKEHGVPLGNIRGHRDYASTACPGRHAYARLRELRLRVAQRVYGFGDVLGVAAWWGVYSERWSSERSEWERQVDEALRALREAGVTTVFFLAKDPWGYVYYNSSLAPLSPKYSWDPLDYVVRRARELGLSVHVYVNALSEGETKPSPLLAEHLEWAVRGENDEPMGWVDPSAEEYVEYLVRLVAEIVRRYDVDGVQLDRIRLPAGVTKLPVSEARFREERGLDPSQDPAGFREYVAERVSEVVRRVRDAVKSVSPSLRVSVAVMPDPAVAREEYCQDWAGWLREGLVDFAVIMSYTSSPAKFKEYLAAAVGASGNVRPVYAGVGAYLSSMTSRAMAEELEAAAKAEGVYGVVLFNVDSLLARRELRGALRSFSERVEALVRQEVGGSESPIRFWLLVMCPAAAAAALAIALLLRRRP